MAIILTPSLQGKFSYILIKDPALDTEREGFTESWEQFLEHGTMPMLKDGLEPTLFELELPTDAELNARITAKHSIDGMAPWAMDLASYSIKGVGNLKNQDGSNLELKFERVNGFPKLCKEHRDLFGVEIMQELGLRCYARQSPS